MKANAEFERLSMAQITNALHAFAMFMGVEPLSCGLEVQGTFTDEEDILVLLESGFYRVDTFSYFTNGMPVYVDGEWKILKPYEGEPIPVVRLCYPRPDSLDTTW